MISSLETQMSKVHQTHLPMTECSSHYNRPYDRYISIGHSHLVTLLTLEEFAELSAGDIRELPLQLGIELIATT